MSTEVKSAAPPARHQRRQRFIIVLGSLALSLLALELPALIGLVDYRTLIGFAVHRPTSTLATRPAHTAVVGEHKGDLVAYYQLADTPTHKVAFTTDRRGFRNPSDPEQAAVVVIGDSFVQNSIIPDAQLFTVLMEEQLKHPVVNLGHEGWGPHEESIMLRRFGFPLRPKVIVWMFYEGNDLADVIQYAGPITSLWEPLFISNLNLRLTALAEHLLHGGIRRNYTWGKGEEPFGTCRQRCLREPCPTLYFGCLADALSLFEEVALRRTMRLLSAAAAEARDKDVTFVLAFAPVTLRVYRYYCDFPTENRASRSALNDLPKRLQQWAADNDVEFLDLTHPLQLSAARGELTYLPDDTHWSAIGNRTVADALVALPAIADLATP